jgi:hypothetical protein
MCGWSVEAATSSLGIIPMNPLEGLHNAVLRLWRDVRDRTARCRNRWRDVSFFGMASGDHTALVMVTHDGVDRSESLDTLRRRCPDVVVKTLEQEQPAVAMSPADAADRGRHRRGVEPMRIVVMPSKLSRSPHQWSNRCRFLCEALAS